MDYLEPFSQFAAGLDIRTVQGYVWVVLIGAVMAVVVPRHAGRDDEIARLNVEQKSSDLAHLLADDDIRRVVWVGLFVDRIKLILGFHEGEIFSSNPTDRGVASPYKKVGIGAELGSDAINFRHNVWLELVGDDSDF